MATHYRAAMIGKFQSGGWNGETVQVGFGGPITDSGTLSPGAINAALPEFDAVATGTTGSTTHFTVSYGSTGVGRWTETNQNTIAEACWTWLNGLKSFQGTLLNWLEVRLSAVEADGSVVNGASVFTMTTPLSATSTMTLPPQCAVVASLGTGGRGPRNRGRMYIPCHSTTVLGTDALVASTPNGSVRSVTKTLIDTVNGIAGIRFSVVSALHQTYSDINRVRCGDEVDTQRRRARNRNEIYSSTAVTS